MPGRRIKKVGEGRNIIERGILPGAVAIKNENVKKTVAKYF